MKEKLRAKIAEGAAPYLESGETVKFAVRGFIGPRIAMFLGALGAVLMTKQVLVVSTDKSLNLMRADRWTITKPKALEERYELGSVDVEFRKGFPYSRLEIGPRNILLHRADLQAANDIAGASSPSLGKPGAERSTA